MEWLRPLRSTHPLCSIRNGWPLATTTFGRHLCPTAQQRSKGGGKRSAAGHLKAQAPSGNKEKRGNDGIGQTSLLLVEERE